MADDLTPDNPEVTAALDETEAALEAGLDVDSPEMDEKLAKLKRALGVTDTDPEGPQPGARQHVGADVDWSEYDLDPKLAHLYPKSRLEMTPEGPRWIVDISEFVAVKEQYGLIGKKITQLINGPEGWRLQSAVVPVSNQHAVVTLQRIFPIMLPTPMLLKNVEDVETQVTAPTQEELDVQEAQALAWAAGEGTPPPPPATPQEAEYPSNWVADQMSELTEAKKQEAPEPVRPVPAAIAAAKEFREAQAGDPDRPND